MTAILSGIRVLDFGRYVAGPYCATLLGYLGADVIRIEKRDGSEDRYIHPLSAQGDGALIHHTGCNKRSLSMDPASPQGREIVRKLVATADIVVASLPASGLRKLGLDYESLRAIGPDIILVSQSGFGSVGPDADKPGFDGVGQALSGAMYFSGQPGAPAKAAASYVDHATAMLSAFGAVSALYHRARTGQGQHVGAALLRTALAIFGPFLTEESALGLGRQPSGNRVQTSAPSDCFATADGHVLIHCVGDGLFKRLARAIGAPDWLDDPNLAGDAARGAQRDALCARVGDWCAGRSTSDVVSTLAVAGALAGPVLTIAEAAAYPHVAAARWLAQVPGLGFDGIAQVVDLPLEFGIAQPGVSRSPPALGADTRDILRELGLSSSEIDALIEA